MGLFGNSNKKILEKALKDAARSGSIKTKTLTCPRCGNRYTVTCLGSNDYKTCSCGYKIYCD